MILCDKDLRSLINKGVLIIEPFDPESLGPTSIDLHLGDTLVTYEEDIIELGKTDPKFSEIELNPETGYTLKPGEFILGCVLERIVIPNGYQGFIETKGDVARAGLQIHNGDGHIDPGFKYVITLEITNLNSIPVVLYSGVKICQIFIFQLSGMCERPYRGKYINQTKPTTYRPK